jgi:hypothetical protein
MTSQDWWLVGARLLGVYLVVTGGLYAAGALAAFGVRLPEGSNQWAYVSTPMLQALITAGAGLWLIFRPGVVPAGSVREAPATSDAFVHALQLLGVFFLVPGASGLLRLLVDIYLGGADWYIRSSEVASAVVDVGAGALLTFVPNRVAGKLVGFVDRASNQSRP